MKLKIKQESNSSSKAGTQAMGEAGWCADQGHKLSRGGEGGEGVRLGDGGPVVQELGVTTRQ